MKARGPGAAKEREKKGETRGTGGPPRTHVMKIKESPLDFSAAA